MWQASRSLPVGIRCGWRLPPPGAWTRPLSTGVRASHRSFVDHVRIETRAGKGGHGAVSYYTDKRSSVGPADGGNGGWGGSVIISADRKQESHLSFGGRRRFRAEDGGHGASFGSTGFTGKDFVLMVPPGTVIYEEEEEDATLRVAADLQHGDSFLASKGGRGGNGLLQECLERIVRRRMHAKSASDAHFTRSFAMEGKDGEKRTYVLELKSIADVGLVGFPNAGKSTLLRTISNATPRVERYPFTTLHPVIGIVGEEDHRLCVADIPGILEDAHRGRGLGLAFLRHIERTRVLVYVLDMSSATATDDLRTLFRELDRYMQGLRQARSSMIVANKLDIVSDPRKALTDLLAWLKTNDLEIEVFPCSAARGLGTEAIVAGMHQLASKVAVQFPRIKPRQNHRGTEGIVEHFAERTRADSGDDRPKLAREGADVQPPPPPADSGVEIITPISSRDT